MTISAKGPPVSPGRAGNLMDDRAAAYLVDERFMDEHHGVINPTLLRNRLVVNPEFAYPFENEFFVGKVVILHRLPDDATHRDPFSDHFKKHKRRWELRWQGRFKRPVDEPIVFGGEIRTSGLPKFNFASKALLSMLVRFSQSLSRKRGSDVYTNIFTEGNETSKHFLFPIHNSDLILATPEGIEPPDLCSTSALAPTGLHEQAKSAFKTAGDVDISKTYTFVFYSMYVDFVSWDVQNVPIGLNGMSLNRIVGSQAVSVVMCTHPDSLVRKDFFRLILANRCSSPDWASFLALGERFNATAMSEFFSVVSSFCSEDVVPVSGSYRQRRDLPTTRQPSPHGWFFRGLKKIVLVPTKYIGLCLKAPVTLIRRRDIPPASGGARRKVNFANSGICSPPRPDALEGEFITPISEADESIHVGSGEK